MLKVVAVLALLASCSVPRSHAFVDRPPIHFSYRYSICPAHARSCAPQGGSMTPSAAEGRMGNLRQRNPADVNGFVLFAGEGDAELVEKVKAVVAEQLGADISKITPQSHFIKDLEADSLDSVELVMAFEEKFGVSIPDEEATKITTVQEAEMKNQVENRQRLFLSSRKELLNSELVVLFLETESACWQLSIQLKKLNAAAAVASAAV
ncbi:hypothetical protein Efla_005046 [Eimeria flavescens]